jgi:hypothetical protein
MMLTFHDDEFIVSSNMSTVMLLVAKCAGATVNCGSTGTRIAVQLK